MTPDLALGLVTITIIHIELRLKSQSFYEGFEISRSEVSRSEFSRPPNFRHIKTQTP